MADSLFQKKLTEKYIPGRMRSESFFRKDCCYVAEHLLGDILIAKKGKTLLAGKIVETEAYPGKKDDASHSFAGRKTDRTRPLFDEGGRAYVYFIYGKYWCFNIVTGKKGDPQSVFIRSLEPLSGISRMKKLRACDDLRKLTNGPCRWTQAFGIKGGWSGRHLFTPELCLIRGGAKDFAVKKTPRIGVDYADKGKHELLRFYIKGNPFVSR